MDAWEELVTLTAQAGLGALDITGTAADNTLIGSATANNTIDGGLGDDLMTGVAGDDTFLFDFSVTQQTESHRDFVNLAGITSVVIDDSIYFKPAPPSKTTQIRHRCESALVPLKREATS